MLWGIVIAMLVIYAVKTYERNLIWESDYTLFSGELKNSPCSPIAHANLSVYYYKKGDKRFVDYHHKQYVVCRQAITDEYASLRKSLKKNLP